MRPDMTSSVLPASLTASTDIPSRRRFTDQPKLDRNAIRARLRGVSSL